MEREFFTDDFENLLRENADQFKMAPSKKVWHGIYNDLHPGRRWPSAMMSLIFIFSLVIVGHLNTQQSQRNYLSNLQKPAQLQKNAQEQNPNNSGKSDNNSFQEDVVSQTNKIAGTTNKTNEEVKDVPFKNLKEIAITNSTKPENTFEPENTPGNNAEVENLFIKNNIFYPENSILSDRNLLDQINTEVTLTSASLNVISESGIEEFTNNNSPVVQNNTELSKKGNKTTHVPVLRIRRNPKVNWTYYLSPLVSYRNYSGTEKKYKLQF